MGPSEATLTELQNKTINKNTSLVQEHLWQASVKLFLGNLCYIDTKNDIYIMIKVNSIYLTNSIFWKIAF